MDTPSSSLPLAPGFPYQSRDGRHCTIISIREDEQTGAPIFFLRDRAGTPGVETAAPVFATQEPRPLYP